MTIGYKPIISNFLFSSFAKDIILTNPRKMSSLSLRSCSVGGTLLFDNAFCNIVKETNNFLNVLKSALDMALRTVVMKDLPLVVVVVLAGRFLFRSLGGAAMDVVAVDVVAVDVVAVDVAAVDVAAIDVAAIDVAAVEEEEEDEEEDTTLDATTAVPKSDAGAMLLKSLERLVGTVWVSCEAVITEKTIKEE